MNRCRIVNILNMYSWSSLLATDRPARSSERTPHNDKTVNVQTKTKIWSWAPGKTRHQDKLAVSHNDTMAGSVTAPTGEPTSWQRGDWFSVSHNSRGARNYMRNRSIQRKVWLEFLTVVIIKLYLLDITPSSPLKVNWRFRGTWRLHLQGRRISQARNQQGTASKTWMTYFSTLNMEVTCSSEMSIGFQRTTQRYIWEDRTLLFEINLTQCDFTHLKSRRGLSWDWTRTLAVISRGLNQCTAIMNCLLQKKR
jgi:hypothetical protein